MTTSHAETIAAPSGDNSTGASALAEAASTETASTEIVKSEVASPEADEADHGDGRGEARREIGIRLAILARMMRHDFDRAMAGLSVTRSQWSMIAVVSRRPGATQRNIAEMLEMSEASAGRLIDRLCGEGLLERREREDDRRARAIYLTPAAEPLVKQLAELAKSSETRLFAGFSEKDVAVLGRLLDRLYANASHA